MESLERLGRTISNGCIAQASVPNSLEEEYDVVLNFRGEDTRRNIVDHLYLSLEKAQINVFMDDPSISFGEEIERKIFAAIERSRIAITIISEDYASSDHCLKELAHILKCMETGRLMVMPIFYKVKPSDIGSFRNSFQRIQSHIIKYPGTIVESWKEALKGIANMKGLLVDGVSFEGRTVRSIVENVETLLKNSPKMNCNQRQERKRDMDHLVGIHEKARDIIKVISEDSNGVQTVGIFGMGGIGKTTLARYIYNQLKHSFEFCSFVTTARQTFSGEVSVDRLISVILGQGSNITNSSNRGMNEIEQFFYNKKVFIVLDDINSTIEMSILMRMRTYFGSGSTIMVITRNRDVFQNHDVRMIYHIRELADDQAMQLFHHHAFGRRRPPDWTVKYTSRVLPTTGGHPLLIEAIGSSLLNKEEVEWESTLKKLENIPFECVQQKLLLCYKALDDNEKQLFLDIAFFPNGFDKQSLFLVLDSADTKALDTLEAMSLVKFDGDNKLYMHDLLRDLGRTILDKRIWYLESLWSNESRCMPKGSKEVFESRPLTDEDAVTPTQLDEQSCSPEVQTERNQTTTIAKGKEQMVALGEPWMFQHEFGESSKGSKFQRATPEVPLQFSKSNGAASMIGFERMEAETSLIERARTTIAKGKRKVALEEPWMSQYQFDESSDARKFQRVTPEVPLLYSGRTMDTSMIGWESMEDETSLSQPIAQLDRLFGEINSVLAHPRYAMGEKLPKSTQEAISLVDSFIKQINLPNAADIDFTSPGFSQALECLRQLNSFHEFPTEVQMTFRSASTCFSRTPEYLDKILSAKNIFHNCTRAQMAKVHEIRNSEHELALDKDALQHTQREIALLEANLTSLKAKEHQLESKLNNAIPTINALFDELKRCGDKLVEAEALFDDVSTLEEHIKANHHRFLYCLHEIKSLLKRKTRI